ncbi:hypothetical protein V6N12_019658 [Hibiscus sabdariffa]|uniref:Uncharacterized protein n=1 Tax=Hibiscus sabdariffa TaxID=183260 RepID=A0ABR2B6I0_9ROSI
MMDSDPPFHETYKTLFAEEESSPTRTSPNNLDRHTAVEERELPLIDLSCLGLEGEAERESCKEEIARAANEWGFFQVINHGISRDILDKMREEQVKVFKQPFYNKCREDKFMNFSAGSYRWGTPTATSLRQLSWSEAFHIPMTDISSFGALGTTFSSPVELFATKVASLAHKLAQILAEKSGHNSTFFRENSLLSSCYLRLNRYPPCPIPLFGLMPHTDSDFLTVLHQDQIGGLQLVKDGMEQRLLQECPTSCGD